MLAFNTKLRLDTDEIIPKQKINVAVDKRLTVFNPTGAFLDLASWEL